MNNPFQVGVTGGIGAGKSIVCRIFQMLHTPVYDADSRARWLMNNDKDLMEKIIQEFGPESYTEGSLDRRYVAGVVFPDPDKLQALNGLVHPAVAQDYSEWKESTSHPYVIREAALLFEAGAYQDLDFLILVTAPEEMKIKRILERDPFRNEKEIREIIGRQWTDERKAEFADAVLENDEKELLIPQVIELHEHFLAQATGRSSGSEI